jgi:hypothetical protein
MPMSAALEKNLERLRECAAATGANLETYGRVVGYLPPVAVSDATLEIVTMVVAARALARVMPTVSQLARGHLRDALVMTLNAIEIEYAPIAAAARPYHERD